MLSAVGLSVSGHSVAWVMSDEPFFSRASDILDVFKLRAAAGTAGGRPRFSAQYEALSLGTGGSITANTLGNKDLKPETTLETEYGIDAELFHKYGVTLTYARAITTDQYYAAVGNPSMIVFLDLEKRS